MNYQYVKNNMSKGQPIKQIDFNIKKGVRYRITIFMILIYSTISACIDYHTIQPLCISQYRIPRNYICLCQKFSFWVLSKLQKTIPLFHYILTIETNFSCQYFSIIEQTTLKFRRFNHFFKKNKIIHVNIQLINLK